MTKRRFRGHFHVDDMKLILRCLGWITNQRSTGPIRPNPDDIRSCLYRVQSISVISLLQTTCDRGGHLVFGFQDGERKVFLPQHVEKVIDRTEWLAVD